MVALGIVVLVITGVGVAVYELHAAAESSGTAGTALSCPATAPVMVGSISVPAGPVAGFCQDRLVNAAHIMNAARAFGIGTHTQAIGVMTAIGESGLRNINYGDVAGPDSRGLFQQRANGAWGTLADRMDPTTAARNFFSALVKIPNWKTLSPTQAAHDVQGNQDPGYYSAYWAKAQRIVISLSPG